MFELFLQTIVIMIVVAAAADIVLGNDNIF